MSNYCVTINHALKCDAESVRVRLTDLGVELPVIAVPAGDSNWDLWIGVAGYCASVPTERTKAQGCKMSGFGDPDYLRCYVMREGLKMASRVDPVILGALGLAVVKRTIREDERARALPLCVLCVETIGGAGAGPDVEWRAAKPGESCGAEDCGE